MDIRLIDLIDRQNDFVTAKNCCEAKIKKKKMHALSLSSCLSLTLSLSLSYSDSLTLPLFIIDVLSFFYSLPLGWYQSDDHHRCRRQHFRRGLAGLYAWCRQYIFNILAI